MTPDGDGEQGDEEREPLEPDAPARPASSLRPDPDWRRPRPQPRTGSRAGWGREDRSAGSPGVSEEAPDSASEPTPATPGTGSVPPPPPPPAGSRLGSTPPAASPAPAGDEASARQGGERPARWAAPRIAASPATSPGAPADTGAPQLPVDEPAPAPSEPPGAPAPAAPAAPVAERSTPLPPPPPPPPTSARFDPQEPPAANLERRGVERVTVVVAELAQQLAATQAQVASLSAQLTTLAHRISYDLERGAQATSERILRDLDQLPDQVTFRVSAAVGPAIDDLTDQVEQENARLRQAVEGDLGSRLRGIGETVEALPLANVEVLNGLQAIGADLEDRLTRFATRIADQVTALESATTSELGRVRERLDELDQASQRQIDQAALDRMAGQVERLAERPTGTTEVIDAVELLVTEHLEAFREGVEARITELGPTLHEELDVVRTEALAGVAASEEVLTERVDALEQAIAAKLDEALGDQVDAIDAVVGERQSQLVGSLPSGTAGQVDLGPVEDLAAGIGAATERLEDAIAVLAAAPRAEAGGAAVDEEALAGIREELKALRRRITLRMEGGDPAPTLTSEQLKELAAQIALHLT